MQLKDHVFIVTGASSGIGLSTARNFEKADSIMLSNYGEAFCLWL